MQPVLRATTTKQLMDQSKLFRFLFFGSIVSIFIAIICLIIFPFSSCYVHSCSWYYYSTYECSNYGSTFCCYNASPYCGSYNCYLKPTGICLGWMIAGNSFFCLGGLMAIFVFIMFCNFRSKLRNGTAYLKMPPVHQYPVYQPPIIVYSDQNQLPGQHPQYQQYVQQPQQPQQRQETSGNQINLSDR